MEITSPLLSVLNTGKVNSTTRRDIANVLGWEMRGVTKEIARLRRLGVPIAAWGKGYYLCDPTTGELDDYCRRFSKRVDEMKKTLHVLEVRRDSVQGAS